MTPEQDVTRVKFGLDVLGQVHPDSAMGEYSVSLFLLRRALGEVTQYEYFAAATRKVALLDQR